MLRIRTCLHGSPLWPYSQHTWGINFTVWPHLYVAFNYSLCVSFASNLPPYSNMRLKSHPFFVRNHSTTSERRDPRWHKGYFVKWMHDYIPHVTINWKATLKFSNISSHSGKQKLKKKAVFLPICSYDKLSLT